MEPGPGQGRPHRHDPSPFYQQMVEHCPYGVFVADRAGAYLYVNDAACTITGYGRDELLTMKLADLRDEPDGGTAGRDHFARVVRDGAASGELPFRHADGSRRWWRIDATRIDDDTLLGFATDVTETRTLHERLEHEREHLERAQEIAGVGWWEADLANDVVNASDRTLAMYGITSTGPVAFSNAQRQVLAEQRAHMDAALGDLVAGRRPYDVQFTIRRADTEERRHLRSLARYDAARHRVFGVILDVTDVTLALEALARQEARFRTIFDSVSECIFLKDLDLRYTHVNRATLEFLGLAEDEIIGNNDDEIFPAEHAADISVTDQLVLDGVTERQRVVREVRGRDRIFETTKVPVRDEAGRVVGLCGVSRDITELRHLEDQLRQSQKLEAIGRLAGGVAHDVNNLLTPILGYADLLKDSLAHDPGSRKELEAIERAGLRARDLTANLLAFSRKQVLDRRVVSINDVIGESREMLRRLLREDIQLRYVLAEDLGVVRADASQLHNVLINLVVNAADAMPDGGRLTVETQNVDLDAPYVATHPEAATGPHILLAVTDTGHGMDSEVRRRAFEPFFTTKPVDEGTGLGLASVHGIVKQHGGTIELYSEPAHGTTFKIYLPRVAAVPSDVPGPLDPAQLAGNEEILVVEDDDAVRQLAAAVLLRYGYRVTALASPATAVAHAAGRDRPYDLLLSDVVMPGMNGAQLHRALRGLWPDMPALFMSGYTENVIAHHGVLTEGLRFIQKPFQPLDLVHRIREILGSH